ncbi:MAG: 2-hydroxyacyl-CoA dehydratase [Phycisphaerae bacterium]|nr:2-hydroxyacyl-CoA dehydratase [Phycisphaerae bacterium]
MIGTLCSYVPEEVIIAAGCLSFRILQVPSEFGRADACLQAYACCLARGTLELGLGGQGEFLDGVVFSNTCDTMQCLADIWSANVEGGFAEIFMMPVRTDHPAARDYVTVEIERLIAGLGERLNKTISAAALQEAVAACRRARGVLADLQEAQRGPTPLLTAGQYYDAIMARWIMPPDEYVCLIESVLAPPHPVGSKGPRLVVAGGPMYAPALPQLIDELGACWVADDLCTGGRAAWNASETQAGAVEAIADRLLSRPICPAKHRPPDVPGVRLVETARRAKADGVVVYRLKFCEPHAFDYPAVKKALDEAGLSSLLIEVETPGGSVGQLRTRLQAFLEMLADRATTERPG